ncbi:MAG TPA: ATP-binding protein [Minicystis sp.]|nr:ATP-binding protein [Minicystis sp.]
MAAPAPARPPPRVVLTGGPGGGKTAVLEVVRIHFGAHVDVTPEAARIVLSGGFPRRATDAARRAAQRAIFRVQRELERLAEEESAADLVLCDRGTVDGAAYWPDGPPSLFEEMGTTRERERARYAAVIHLRPPPEVAGAAGAPGSQRVETVAEALAIDARIERAWEGHPRRVIVESTPRFFDKIARVL